jgi:hypothetical protein
MRHGDQGALPGTARLRFAVRWVGSISSMVPTAVVEDVSGLSDVLATCALVIGPVDDFLTTSGSLEEAGREREVKAPRLAAQGPVAVVSVEALGALVLGLDDEGLDRDLGAGGALQGVPEEGSAQAPAVAGQIDGQTTESRDRNEGVAGQASCRSRTRGRSARGAGLDGRSSPRIMGGVRFAQEETSHVPTPACRRPGTPLRPPAGSPDRST